MAASPPPALGRLPAASRALLLLAVLEGTGDLGVLAAAAGRSGVLDGLPPGLTNKQIAERLYLSHRTVSSHLYKLFPKLGINSRAALRAALVSPRPR